jgi:hypothetical protein
MKEKLIQEISTAPDQMIRLDNSTNTELIALSVRILL